MRRLEGELLLFTDSDPEESEACFVDSLRVARDRHNRALELRAAMSLCRYALSRERSDKGLETLEPVYKKFDEGFDTLDLREAWALIERCRASAG